MRTPTEFEIEQLLHADAGYDPVKAHEYYLRTRELKGRKKASSSPSSGRRSSGSDPRTGKTRDQIAQEARAKQRKELQEQISMLEDRLKKLEAFIKKRIHEEKSEDRKGKAKKERAAKERDKPDSAAEKADKAREAEKYRDKHKQELKNKDKKNSDGKGKGSSKGKKLPSSELKTLATKIKGKIAVAKQKLAAL